MKRALVLVSALLLTAGLAWAGEPAAEPALDGGCVLPDLAGLSPDEIAAATLAAGLDLSSSATTTAAATPACPVRFDCTSIFNCGPGSLCAIKDIGPCCNPGGGLTLCCISGTIKVQRCPCRCTGNPCAFRCINSTDVKWSCS